MSIKLLSLISLVAFLFIQSASSKNNIVYHGGHHEVISHGNHVQTMDFIDGNTIVDGKITFKDGTSRMLTDSEKEQLAQYKLDVEAANKEWQDQFQENMNQWKQEHQQWMENKGYMNGVPVPTLKQPPPHKFPTAPVFDP